MLDSVNELSASVIRTVLSATHAEGNYTTLYSCIYDLKAGLVNVHYFHNFEEVVTFNLTEELKKGNQRIELATLFSVQPHAAQQFLDRQPKPSYPILSGFYDRYGAAAALTRYEEMCRTTRLESYYDIGDEQIGRLASEMLRRGDTQAALDFYTSLSRHYPDSWQAYAGIGRVEMTLDHKAEAIQAFRRSLALNRDNPWVADMMKGLEKELGEQLKLMGKDSSALTKETPVLPQAVLLPIPNRSQEPDAPDLVWDAETCIQMGMAYYKTEVSQKAICAAGKPLKSSLNGYEIDPALEALGVESFSWDWRNRDVTQFLAWIKTNLAKGYPVLCGIKMNPTQHPEWSIDHFVLVVGYNEGGLFIDTNISGDGRILVTYSQLASLTNRYAFENKYRYYFGRAFLGVKESEITEAPAQAAVKPVPQLKPIAVDSSKMKRLTGRYTATAGAQARIITFDGEKLFSHKQG
jgi:tetratricopeptide (TPR) repeat protein